MSKRKGNTGTGKKHRAGGSIRAKRIREEGGRKPDEAKESGAGVDVRPEAQDPPSPDNQGGRGKERGDVRRIAGRADTVTVPGRDPLAVEYAVVEFSDLNASHLPEQNFAKNPAYEFNANRDYELDFLAKGTVEACARRLILIPHLLLMGSRQSSFIGPPLVDARGNVLGGNETAMAMQLAFSHTEEIAKEYRKTLEIFAPAFGIDPKSLASFSRPVLVRKLLPDMEKEEIQLLIPDLNPDDFRLKPDDLLAPYFRGKQLYGETLFFLLAGMRGLDRRPLWDFFDSDRSHHVLSLLFRDGVLQESERQAFIDPETSRLNRDGQRAMEAALRCMILEGPEQVYELPGNVLLRLEFAAPYILRLELESLLRKERLRQEGRSVGDECSLGLAVREALGVFIDYRQFCHSCGAVPPKAFVESPRLITGKSPLETYSRQAVAIFMSLAGDRAHMELSRRLSLYLAMMTGTNKQNATQKQAFSVAFEKDWKTGLTHPRIIESLLCVYRAKDGFLDGKGKQGILEMLGRVRDFLKEQGLYKNFKKEFQQAFKYANALIEWPDEDPEL